MARPGARLGFIQFCFLLGILAVLGRSAQLQLVRGAKLAADAKASRTVRGALPARRGTILDRGGSPLAMTQESYRVSLAPEQVMDVAGTARLVGHALGQPPAVVERRLRRERSVYFSGPFNAVQVQPIRGRPGVYLEPIYPRIRPMGNLAQYAIGVMAPDSERGASGIERTLDSVLAGVAGEAVWVKDHRGRRYESPSRLVREPVAGNDVVLTIDAQLQQIAEAALDAAIARMEAEGGNVVFLDPRTGELLAVASRTSGEKSGSAAFTAPFQPGSTAKLFTAAALLAHGLVDSTDWVGGEQGSWLFQPPSGRPYRITDTHAAREPLTLALAIEKSSNIAMAKFAQRLAPEQLYDMLRDFGFGSPTGVEFPAESRGVLTPVSVWRAGYSRESMSRGYEFSVTAVQLAAAYAVIANGGTLYTPALVREIRAPDGAVLYRHRPEPVRRVLAPEVAATLRDYLRGAVSSVGTGERAQLQSYQLAGKTGTSRKTENGRYVSKYVASFAAIWPADRPQLVAIVMIDAPRGGYYGGETAAPLTKLMLEEALTSRNRALDFDQLAHRDSAPGAVREDVAVEAQREARPPVVAIAWPVRGRRAAPLQVPVPEVGGSTPRAAAATLHRAGFRVALRGSGVVIATDPPPGTAVRRGSTITLTAEPPRLR